MDDGINDGGARPAREAVRDSPFPPTGLAELVRLLNRDSDFRVLRRASPIRRDEGLPARKERLLGVALACTREPAGAFPPRLAELGLQRFWASADGRIRVTDVPSYWPCLPAAAGPPAAACARTRRLVEAEAASILLDVDLIVAQAAAADRPLVQERLPCTEGVRWVDASREVDWEARGYDASSLTSLLMGAGLFRGPGRAEAALEAAALVCILDLDAPGGGTVLGEAVAAAARPGWLIEVGRVPTGAHGVLAERGYRWDPVDLLWRRPIPAHAFDEEYEWAVLAVYDGRGAPGFREIGWRERYAGPPRA